MSNENRHLAAILFTDIVGYTTLVAEDEANGAAVRDQHRRLVQTLVEQYHGRWVEETGDETLSIFPSSLDAVHCALAIQASLADEPAFSLRIGIHIGDVLERDGRLIGDAVNIAARIRPLAEPGGVCVSVRVYEDVRSHPEIAAKPVGERALKNIELPVQIYTVTRVDGDRTSAAAPRKRFRALGFVAATVAILVGAYLFRTPLAQVLIQAGLVAVPPPYEQEIAFATTSDGVRIAYSTVGDGPPVIAVLGWVTHLERGYGSPQFNFWSPGMVERHRLVQYDGRGSGLSDRGLGDYSLENKLKDLEAVIEAAGLERFALYGISAGGAVAIAYAVRHPERVSKLIFYGSFARLTTLPGQQDQWRAFVPLVRGGWGSDNPAFRQLFTQLFMPDGSDEDVRFFNEIQRLGMSADDAADFIKALPEIDVTALAPQVRVPTLVIHKRGDAIVPFENGRELASLIPGARLLTIDGNNHAPAPGSREWNQITQALQDFVAADTEQARLGRTAAE